MLIQAHAFHSYGFVPRTLVSARTPSAMCDLKSTRNEWRPWRVRLDVFYSGTRAWNRRVSQLGGIMRVRFPEMKSGCAMVSASLGQSSSVYTGRKRKVVEHVCLLKAKEGLSDEKEKDMMDYLYTSQYQMGGIVAVSIGRISDRNLENYTHAFYMRFQRKDDLTKFYSNPFYLGVLKDYVNPYCHFFGLILAAHVQGLINVDYESEVEDDILPIFRKGEEFNYGVEFVLLIKFVESAADRSVDDALSSLAKLTMEFPSLVVQATQGSNFNQTSKEYTHGVVIRFRSFEAFEMFMNSSEYKDVWSSKFQSITSKTLPIHFSVDPVGTEIM